MTKGCNFVEYNLSNNMEFLYKPVNPFDHCKTCEHTDAECKDCYPELGYKNNKMKRDTEAVEKFTESDVFKQLMGGKQDADSN